MIAARESRRVFMGRCFRQKARRVNVAHPEVGDWNGVVGCTQPRRVRRDLRNELRCVHPFANCRPGASKPPAPPTRAFPRLPAHHHRLPRLRRIRRSPRAAHRRAAVPQPGPLPENAGPFHRLDCAVLNFGLPLLERESANPYHSVRGVFQEGSPAFDGSEIRKK